MGLPAGLFLRPPDPSLICPICRGVLDDPSSLQCGHLFCRACLSSYQENGGALNDGGSRGGSSGNGSSGGRDRRKFRFQGVSIVCPTCRHIAVVEEDDPSPPPSTPRAVATHRIEHLQIRCRNQLAREEGKECEEGEESCNWTGKLGAYSSHAAQDCPLEVIPCRASNCHHRQRRGAMRSGGYCHRPECARTIASQYLSGKSLDFLHGGTTCAKNDSLEGTAETGTCDKENSDVNHRELSRGSGNKENNQVMGNGRAHLQTLTRCAQTTDDGGDNNVETVSGDKEKANINYASGGSGTAAAPKEGGLMTQRLARLCLEADRILAKPFTPHNDVEAATPPKSQTRKQVHDDDTMVSPRPWAMSTPSKSTPRKKSGGAGKKRPDKNGENDDTAKKEAAAVLNATRDENGNSSAFVIAAVKVLVAKEMSKIRRQDAAQAMFVHRHLMEFCRSWMRRKPEALHDFAVYRPKTCRATSLLVGIPGPKRTVWEGGLFPLHVQWNDLDGPPQCRFPREFHHANVDPTGLVSLSTLKKDWHPEIAIAEILFDIQQLLAHPNHDEPAQPEARHSYKNGLYDHKTTIQTSLYLPRRSLLPLLAAGIEGCGAPSSWQLVEDEALSGRKETAKQRPKRPKEPVFASSHRKGACRCSCCAWGQTLWDSRREMRYLFGKGGSSDYP
ncbi:hypothetical protein ACHAXT_006092 [Thalassiosira profunda]